MVKLSFKEIKNATFKMLYDLDYNAVIVFWATKFVCGAI